MWVLCNLGSGGNDGKRFNFKGAHEKTKNSPKQGNVEKGFILVNELEKQDADQGTDGDTHKLERTVGLM